MISAALSDVRFSIHRTDDGIVQRSFYFLEPRRSWCLFPPFSSPALPACSANESILVLESINPAMGSLWAHPACGIWWAWDARLTSAFLLLLIYGAYVIVRQSLEAEQRATICAVICIFGMADVPLVYLSNRLFRTQHPAPVIGGGENSGLAPDMLFTFLYAHIAMVLLW
ncbi:MAG: cytochrome c biogenesis protein CcsA, partial [Bryobacteraceae bacterium]